MIKRKNQIFNFENINNQYVVLVVLFYINNICQNVKFSL